MPDPFRNYDAWLQAPLARLEYEETVTERMLEVWHGSDDEREAFDDWWSELVPDDLPLDLYTALFDHWRTLGHWQGRFEAFVEKELEAEAEPPWDTMREWEEAHEQA